MLERQVFKLRQVTDVKSDVIYTLRRENNRQTGARMDIAMVQQENGKQRITGEKIWRNK